MSEKSLKSTSATSSERSNGDDGDIDLDLIVDAVRVRTEQNELTLRQISESLPDTETIMARVGHSWWHLYYAAEGGNWGLADYYLRRVGKLDNLVKLLRPKHKERMERFQATVIPAVEAAVAAHDFKAFKKAYDAATDMAKVGAAEDAATRRSASRSNTGTEVTA
jgi:hypothetical protein